MNRVYFDNAATTPICKDVQEAMAQAIGNLYGNPSSIHTEGRNARAAIEEARKKVANYIGASIGEIFFTSGGTESNNTALKCAVRDLGVKRIISSPLEHHCILHSLDSLESAGVIERVNVNIDQEGNIDIKHLEELLQSSDVPTLVSLMHSNNEVGTLLPLEKVAALCEENNAYFHSDTVQTVGYFPIDVSKTPISFLSGSAHKFYGPKGIGFIYVNANNQIKPYMDGGAQERNMRGGTENIYGIIGLAKGLESSYEELDIRRAKTTSVRNYMKEQLMAHFPDITFNGNQENYHYKVLSASFPPSDKADLLLLNLDMAGISVSGGSACSSGAEAGSHVIGALHGDSPRKTIRFSFSHSNTKEEVDFAISKLRVILPEMAV
ncbi:MAG: cysteine desulfurase [Chitinophagales bacterium]|nr:cysteine desulfurase [Chitinophagales bacterium]